MKIVPFILAAAFALSLALVGCGNESPKPEKSSGGAAATSQGNGDHNNKPDGGSTGATPAAGGW